MLERSFSAREKSSFPILQSTQCEADRLLVCLQALNDALGAERQMSQEDRRRWVRGAYQAIRKELGEADIATWQRFASQLARLTAALPQDARPGPKG